MQHGASQLLWTVNSSPTWQNGRRFADDIFKCFFLNEKFCIVIRISLEFVPKGPIDNKWALVQVMAWCQTGADYVHWHISVALGWNESNAKTFRDTKGPCYRGLTSIQHEKWITSIVKCGMTSLIHYQTSTVALYWACDYLWMPEFKLNQVSERVPSSCDQIEVT